MPVFSLTKLPRVAPEKMPVLRRDFVENPECDFCHRPLDSTTAYILKPEAKEPGAQTKELRAGPKCAEKFGIDPAHAPDLTGGAVLVRPASRLLKSNLITPPILVDVAGLEHSAALNEREKDARYLLLCKNLMDLGMRPSKGPGAELVGEALEAYAKDPATADLGYINWMRTKAEEGHPRDRLDTMETVYAAAFWIDRCEKSRQFDNGQAYFLRQQRQELAAEFGLKPENTERLNGMIEHMTHRGLALKAGKLLPAEPQSRMKFGDTGLLFG